MVRRAAFAQEGCQAQAWRYMKHGSPTVKLNCGEDCGIRLPGFAITEVQTQFENNN
jgi:hypothetical protein